MSKTLPYKKKVINKGAPNFTYKQQRHGSKKVLILNEVHLTWRQYKM